MVQVFERIALEKLKCSGKKCKERKLISPESQKTFYEALAGTGVILILMI